MKWCLIILCLLPGTIFAENKTGQLNDKQALAVSQAAVGTALADYQLRDQYGAPFMLHDLLGKPLVISLVYTSCYHTCPSMTKQLQRVVEIAREALGDDSFHVLTIGFDTANDTPDRMNLFAKERGIDMRGWTFASADKHTIGDLTRQLGFTYFPSPRGFDHLTQTTVVDEQGVVHQQVYGEMIHAPALVEPLKQLVWDIEAGPANFSGWLNSVKLFCTVYDPNTGRYRFDYSLFVGIFIGVLCLGSAAVFVYRSWRQGPQRPV